MKSLVLYVLFSFLFSNVVFSYSMLQSDSPSMVKFLFSGDEEEKEKETSQTDKDPEFRVNLRLHAFKLAFMKSINRVFIGEDIYSNHISEILTPPPEIMIHPGFAASD